MNPLPNVDVLTAPIARARVSIRRHAPVIETTISTIRHARTKFNLERRYAGSIDVPLSDEGIREATEAARGLAGTKFDVVVTSTLSRAWQTAQLLVGDRVPIFQTSLCGERNFGIMEGLTWDEVQQLQPPILIIRVGDDFHTVNPKGAEAFEDVWQRAKEFRRYLFRNYPGQRVLVVSHGVFLQFFHGLLRGVTCIECLAAFPANLELARFRFEGDRLAGEAVSRLHASACKPW